MELCNAINVLEIAFRVCVFPFRNSGTLYCVSECRTCAFNKLVCLANATDKQCKFVALDEFEHKTRIDFEKTKLKFVTLQLKKSKLQELNDATNKHIEF